MVRILVSLGDRHARIDEITSQYPTCAVTSLTPISSSRLMVDDVDKTDADPPSSRINSARHRAGSRTGSLVTPRSRRVSPVPSPSGSPRSSRTKPTEPNTSTVNASTSASTTASTSASMNVYPTNSVIPSRTTPLSTLAESNRRHSSFDHNHSEHSTGNTTPPPNKNGRGSLDKLPPIASPLTNTNDTTTTATATSQPP